MQEVEDPVAQIKVDSRQSDKIGSGDGQDQGVQLRIRRCGTCNETGRNMRTCQIAVETSNEEDLYSDN